MFCALLVRGDIMKTNIELISTRVYAGRLKDRENLNNSSSGGAFTALSDFFLKKGLRKYRGHNENGEKRCRGTT